MTLNISAMMAAGVTLDELFNADEARVAELFALYPGPDVTVTKVSDEDETP